MLAEYYLNFKHTLTYNISAVKTWCNSHSKHDKWCADL